MKISVKREKEKEAILTFYKLCGMLMHSKNP